MVTHAICEPTSNNVCAQLMCDTLSPVSVLEIRCSHLMRHTLNPVIGVFIFVTCPITLNVKFSSTISNRFCFEIVDVNLTTSSIWHGAGITYYHFNVILK